MKIVTIFLSLLLISACSSSNTTPKVNESSINPEGLPTAQDQSEKADDRQITKQIRLRLLQDDDLSVIATNIRIITKDGAVTLMGKVSKPFEKQKIDKLARETKGVKSLDNQLEVAK